MKKVFLAATRSDFPETVTALRDCGVLHIEHCQPPENEDVIRLRRQVQDVQRALDILDQQAESLEPEEPKDWEAVTQEILGLVSLIHQMNEGMARRQAKISQWEPWGNFSPDDVERLARRNVFIQLVEVPEKRLAELPEDLVVAPIFKQEGVVRCCVISYPEPADIPFPVLPLPTVSLNVFRMAQEKNKRRIQMAEKRLLENTRYREALERVLCHLRDELAFHEVLAGRGEEEALVYVKGFVPTDQEDGLLTAARRHRWGILTTEPDDDDAVPTLLKNPPWARLVNPILKFINILPGYREFDISPVFLVFFSLFVGMLIGDAGYGILFLLLTGYSQLVLGKKVKDKEVFPLAYLLCLSVIGWGLLSGTFFGQQWLENTLVRPLFPWLRDEVNIQKLCFWIGAIQLSLAHAWQSLRRLPQVTFLSEVGWIVILWSMLPWVNHLVLGAPRPGLWGVGLGALFVLFFTAPQTHLGKLVMAGLGSLGLKIINTFTDIISYIRLFAVGLATVAVADATNMMASSVGFSSWGHSIGAFLILFLGHGINIILALMALLVHGLRLNVLEFSGHLDMEWAGEPYRPFRKIKAV